ncbi:conserved Plasmodium protein, unknown function [Plasmodium malariae]|uniref:Uncharacterized protein n=1 Tax=Plasmodium malariae TaxID=5858 RepID=A0A1C3L364_PLAMA|nr:conserved Plasmodium protein, unknown function [Plasmodium malariae]
MKIDKKKEFKKKLTMCISLLQVSDPLKIIIDETFIKLCIVHKICIKDELSKLLNRQLLLMTTKCISQYAKKSLQEETAYGLRKLTHYKCNHNEENIKDSVNNFLKKKKNESSNIFSVNYFENQVNVTHNFDSLYNVKSQICKKENKSNQENNNEKNEQLQEKTSEKRIENGQVYKVKNNIENVDNTKGGGHNQPNDSNICEDHGEDNKRGESNELSDSMKCIIDLVKNNNEKKFFLATNNLELRSFLRKVFIVPIIYISEGGVIKMESLSTKNLNKKENVELKKMKMLKWERELKKSEQRKNGTNIRKSVKKKKKKKKNKGVKKGEE